MKQPTLLVQWMPKASFFVWLRLRLCLAVPLVHVNWYHFVRVSLLTHCAWKWCHTIYWEIFAVKKFSRLSVTTKISRTKFFLQRNTVTVFLIQEVHCRPQYHPRRLLQQIEKWKKPSVPCLVGNVGHTGSIVLTIRAEIGIFSTF